MKQLLLTICVLGPQHACVVQKPQIMVEASVCRIGTIKGEIAQDGKWQAATIKIGCAEQ